MSLHSFTVPKRPRAVQAEHPGTVSAGRGADAFAQRAARLARDAKAALHITIHRSARPTKAIADYAGLSYSFLANSALGCSPNQLPFTRLPLVLEASSDLTLVRFFADLQHADVLERPHEPTGADAHQASETLREFAEFVEASAAALDDGVITVEEFARIEREGLEAAQAILQTIAGYRVRVQRPLLEGM